MQTAAHDQSHLTRRLEEQAGLWRTRTKQEMESLFEFLSRQKTWLHAAEEKQVWRHERLLPKVTTDTHTPFRHDRQTKTVNNPSASFHHVHTKEEVAQYVSLKHPSLLLCEHPATSPNPDTKKRWGDGAKWHQQVTVTSNKMISYRGSLHPWATVKDTTPSVPMTVCCFALVFLHLFGSFFSCVLCQTLLTTTVLNRCMNQWLNCCSVLCSQTRTAMKQGCGRTHEAVSANRSISCLVVRCHSNALIT